MTETGKRKGQGKTRHGGARDKIAQTYLGLWGSPASQQRARERIDWLAENAQGRKVLDGGCSEGILAVLLGRAGFDVTGVDIQGEAVRYARELLQKESAEVRKRVRFIEGDIFVVPLADGSFDTVVLGEILEHIDEPQRLISRAFALLKPGGRLLITTPFGYHPDEDHRHSFVLSDLAALLRNRCVPEDLSVTDHYIRFMGCFRKPTPKDRRAWSPAGILRETERAVMASQKYLRERLAGKEKRADDTLKLLEAERRRSSEFRETAEEMEKDRARLISSTKKNMERLNGLISNLQQKIVAAKDERDRLSNSLLKEQKKGEKEKAELRKEIQEWEQERATLRGAVEENRTLHRRLDDLVRSRNQVLAGSRRLRSDLADIRESIGFRAGETISAALLKPGREMVLLPLRLLGLFREGLEKIRKSKSPAVAETSLRLPSGRTISLPLKTNSPQYLFPVRAGIDFSFPGNRSGYLTTKDSTNFDAPGGGSIPGLEAGHDYVLSGSLRMKKGRATVWVIEHGRNGQVRKHRLGPGTEDFELPFRTGKDYLSACIAFRLEGEGTVPLEGFEIRTSRPGVERRLKGTGGQPEKATGEPVLAFPATGEEKPERENSVIIRRTAAFTGSRPSSGYLFFCTNGAGLGHITRSLAVARRLRRQDSAVPIIFLTTSQALELFTREEMAAYHIPPYSHLNRHLGTIREWHDLLREKIRWIAENHGPDTFVFDGVSIYSGLFEALLDGPFQYKAMILRVRNKHSQIFQDPGRFSCFDTVLIAGEAGMGADPVDILPPQARELPCRFVSPIIYLDKEELLHRKEARWLLRIPSGKTAVYVQLGAGRINRIDDIRRRILSHLKKRKDVEVILAESPIADWSQNGEEDCRVIRSYPNALYFNGIDLAVTATGYNTFHELMHYGIPSVQIPNAETGTDDQVLRAQIARDAGAVLAVTDLSQLENTLDRALQPDIRAALAETARLYVPENGAAAAAALLQSGGRP